MKLKMSLLFTASVSAMIVLACSEVVFPTPLPTATPAPTATPIVFPTPLPTATPFAVVFPTPLPTVTPAPTATPMSVPEPGAYFKAIGNCVPDATPYRNTCAHGYSAIGCVSYAATYIDTSAVGVPDASADSYTCAGLRHRFH